MSLYDKIFPPRKIVLSSGKTVFRPASRFPLIALILVFLTALSVKITGFDMRVLLERGNQFFVILGMMVPPAFSYSSQVWKPYLTPLRCRFWEPWLARCWSFPLQWLLPPTS